jgi:two-component system cell cycle response regulator
MSMKILTIDDSKTIRMIVAKAFRPYLCKVLEAENGVAGLAIAQLEKPDVILLDYTMPVMDGFEVLARLRADRELKTTPVIMLTAEAGRDTIMKIAGLGVRDYLIKPFKGELLVERVIRVLPLKLNSEGAERPRRFDDPIRILVVDDKPAIVVQIRAALTDTPWQVTDTDQSGQALNKCADPGADIVLASLSLPNDGAYMLLQELRSHANTATIPIVGMSIRTAKAEQARAQQAGFAGNISKPIEAEELRTMISRTLKLETSYKYFKQCGTALALTFPKDSQENISEVVSSRLDELLGATVEAGGDRLIIDLSAMETVDFRVIKLMISAVESCGKLSMKHMVVAQPAAKAVCQRYEESNSWSFVDSFDDALSSAKQPIK